MPRNLAENPPCATPAPCELVAVASLDHLMAEVINFQREKDLHRVRKGLQGLLSGYDGRVYTEELRGEIEGEVRAFLTSHIEVPMPWRVVDLGTAEDRQSGVIRMNVEFPVEEVKLEIEVGEAP